MDTIDRTSLRRLMDKVNAALAVIATEEGLVIHTGRASFTDRNATIKVEVATKGLGGVVNTKAADALAVYGPMEGLDVKVGTEFLSRGEVFRISGYKPRATRLPVIAVRASDGKAYKFEVETVKRALESRKTA